MQALVTAPRKKVIFQLAISQPGLFEIPRNDLDREPTETIAVLCGAKDQTPLHYTQSPPYTAHPVDERGRVLGSDVAAIAEKAGSDVKEWSVRDRVAGLLQGGDWQKLIIKNHPWLLIANLSVIQATSRNSRSGGFAEYTVLEADLDRH